MEVLSALSIVYVHITDMNMALRHFRVYAMDMNSGPLAKRRRLYRQTARAQASEDTARRIAQAFADCVKDRWFDEITLDEVAERAGVTVRTVVRRFGGKEGLVAGFFEYVAPQIRLQRTVDPGDTEGAVDRVLELYEDVGDSVIRNLAQEPRHEALKTLLEGGRRGHRMITAESFAPFLDRLRGKERRRALDALIVATDVYTWKLLRRDMGRSVRETKAVMLRLIANALSRVPPHKPARGNKP
jgi:AcrR family transcriptional regulator